VLGGVNPIAAALPGHGIAALVAVQIAMASSNAGAGTRLAVRVAAADRP
jgi:hypothetical protein